MNDNKTNNGATGCTDTVLQWLIWLWTGKMVSHDAIRGVAGNPPRTRGLRPSEVQKVITHYRLPYLIRYDLSAPTIRALANQFGPVGFGHDYYWWPDWKGYRLGGSATDGRPNGFASPAGRAGKTQSTWRGPHFGLLLGTATSPTEPDVVYAWEPNHNSPSRPEDPAYDKMSQKQFDAVYDSYKRSFGRRPYAIVPTRVLPT